MTVKIRKSLRKNVHKNYYFKISDVQFFVMYDMKVRFSSCFKLGKYLLNITSIVKYIYYGINLRIPLPYTS